MLRNCSVFAVEGLRGTEHCHQFAICSQLGTEYFSASSAEECRFGFVGSSCYYFLNDPLFFFFFFFQRMGSRY